MREAQDEQAIIHDVDSQTFSRFCQRIYTGTYIISKEEDMSGHKLDEETFGKLADYASLEHILIRG